MDHYRGEIFLKAGRKNVGENIGKNAGEVREASGR
jgi:hypothetical protein